MERVILHCDLNSFFASVEQLYHPEIKNMPLAVGGNAENRHGIILSVNQLAKAKGVKVPEPLWQARKKCPDLIILSPHYDLYLMFSKRVREIFADYTDYIEPFGLDEAWLDVTGSKIIGDGKAIADIIRNRIHDELGITASVGVSFNKIFAKLGSDLRKPDYTTIISKENFKEVVWPLKVGDLLFVGKSTAKYLNDIGIKTIGQLANCDLNFLKKYLGKSGEMLWSYANGLDDSPVARFDYKDEVKSISNSMTCPRDLVNDEDLDIVLSLLADNIAKRLRDSNLMAQELTISFRDNDLKCFTRQMPINKTNLAADLLANAKILYKNNYFWDKPLRSVGLRVNKLTDKLDNQQLSLFDDLDLKEKEDKLENTVDDIRKRYGFSSIKRASSLLDDELTKNQFDD